MNDVRSALQQGLKYLQNGDIEAAVNIFGNIVATNPKNTDALHLLGISHSKNNNSREAIRLIRKAIKISPNEAIFHRNLGLLCLGSKRYNKAIESFNKAIRLDRKDSFSHNDLGTVYSHLGKTEEAIREYRIALSINPKNHIACNNLGNDLIKTSEYDKAISAFGRAIQINSNYAEAYSGRCNVLRKIGETSNALDDCNKAIHINPNHAEAYTNRGDVLKDLGVLDDSLADYNEAIRLDPDYAGAYVNRGNLFKDIGRLSDALGDYNEAILINPKCEEAYSNRGNLLKDAGKLDDALEDHSKAIQINPNYAEAYSNRGGVFRDLGRVDDALSDYHRSIQVNPNYARGHFNYSMVLLLLGRFIEGWKEYEWRWKTKEFIRKKNGIQGPLWNGSELNGKTILIYSEQGNGDTIQFIRYVSQIKKYGGRVVVKCPQSLKRLLSHVDGINLLVVEGDSVPEYDVQLPLLSVPHILKTDEYSIPADIPYIFPEDDLSIESLSYSYINVGIVWAGSPTHKNDRNRSIKVDYFVPLASIPDVQLYSLQVGTRSSDLDSPAVDNNIVDLSSNISDYKDTASCINKLDLVITVDTSVAHLAGAIGKTVWVLLPFSPDFRWLLECDDSPWYPTMRLFRQNKRGNWGEVFENVAQALREYEK